jgi:uncharacterized protein YbjQ (UPF0145 family)
MNVISSLRACVVAGMIFVAQPVFASDLPVSGSPAANDEAGVPVYPYDITDRPYEVLGEVHAGVRKATIFSQAPDQAKVYRVLWKNAQKLRADAVIKAQYGDPHITALSWGSVSATGIAVRFTSPSQPAKTAN